MNLLSCLCVNGITFGYGFDILMGEIGPKVGTGKKCNSGACYHFIQFMEKPPYHSVTGWKVMLLINNSI